MNEILETTSSTDNFWPPIESDKEPDEILNGFGIESDMDPAVTVVKSKGENLLTLLREAERSILENSGGSVVKLFKFPPAIKTACEQYLLYFGQFLKDLGIDAETELKEEASRVLFTVTPTDKSKALDSIREALNCYLQMPSSLQTIPMAESRLGVISESSGEGRNYKCSTSADSSFGRP